MVEKDGKVGEEAAKKAYRAAREETDQDAGEDVDEKVSSALINRVHIFGYSYVMISANHYHSGVNFIAICFRDITHPTLSKCDCSFDFQISGRCYASKA